MEYNRLIARLRSTEDELAHLDQRRVDLEEQLAWAANFDPDLEAEALERLSAELDKCRIEGTRLARIGEALDTTSTALATQTPRLERDARLVMRALRFFSTDQANPRARLKAHQQELARHRHQVKAVNEQQEQVAGEAAELAEQVACMQEALERFRGFDPDEADAAIARIDARREVLETERDHLSSRAAEVEGIIEAPLAVLREYESDVDNRESEVAKLRSERDQVERQIDDVERIDKRISNESNPYERKLLHDELKREFGQGSPGKVLRALERKRDSRTQAIDYHGRQLDRLHRNIGKTRQRVEELVEVALREIDAIVVDGNNSCYQDGEFIGLAALRPLTQQLAQRFPVTVVFDSDIRGRLKVRDDDLRTALPDVGVHVVASRRKADETILDLADPPTTWVISNDQYGDFREKAAVRERRLITHEIVGGRVLVHDLGINEQFSVQSG